MLFHHKELYCEKCGTQVSKKDVCIFDYSLQGRNKGGNKILLCQNCCLSELETVLRNYPQKAVVVQPSAGFNAYVFYAFQDLQKSDEHSVGKDKKLQQIEELESLLLHDDTKCTDCPGEATMLWCSANLFEGGDPYSFSLNFYERENCVPLCTECLIRAFRKKVEEEQIRFRWVIPRIDNRAGYYTPWDV